MKKYSNKKKCLIVVLKNLSFASINSANYLDFDTCFNQFETTEQCYHSYCTLNSQFFSTKTTLLSKQMLTWSQLSKNVFKKYKFFKFRKNIYNMIYVF